MLSFIRKVQETLASMDSNPEWMSDITSFLERIQVTSPAGLRFVATTTPEPDDRAIALWLLARLQDRRDVATTTILLASLDSREAKVRSEAARSFAVRRTPHAILPLARLLRDPDEDVRRAAAYGLGQMGYPDAAARLCDVLLDKNETPSIRGMAAESLGQLGSPADELSSAAIVAALSDCEPEVRYWSALAVASLGITEAKPALKRLLDDPSSVEPFGTISQAARNALRALPQ